LLPAHLSVCKILVFRLDALDKEHQLTLNWHEIDRFLMGEAWADR